MNDPYIRASLWSLVKLGLIDGPSVKHPMKIIYMLQFSRNGCMARCRFCAQSITNTLSKKFLSRITWPAVKLSQIINALRIRGDDVKRICLQTIIKPWFLDEALMITKKINYSIPDKPISLAITPVPKKFLEKFKEYGVDYLGVGLDAASPEVFKKVSKPYTWKVFMKFIEDGIKTYGYKKVVVHLIVGLGEKPLELYTLMEKLVMKGADIALFAYIPIDKGLIKPVLDLEYYREAQIVRYFLLRGYRLREILGENGRVGRDIIGDIVRNVNKYTRIFITSGCPYCNRPYYNESPRGPFYNFYSEKHVMEHLNDIINSIEKLG